MRKAIFFNIIVALFCRFEAWAIGDAGKAEPVKSGIAKLGKKSGDITTALEKIIDHKRRNVKPLMLDNQELDNVKRAVESFKSGDTLELEDPEIDEIALEEQRKKELIALNERSKIHLGSILYIAKNKWAIWLNKDKITSDSNNKDGEFFVKSVTRERASILWALSLSKWKILSGKLQENENLKINDKNQVLINFTLKPNQTFLLRHNEVIEGRDVSLASKEEEKEAPKKEKKSSPEKPVNKAKKPVGKELNLEKKPESSAGQIKDNKEPLLEIAKMQKEIKSNQEPQEAKETKIK